MSKKSAFEVLSGRCIFPISSPIFDLQTPSKPPSLRRLCPRRSTHAGLDRLVHRAVGLLCFAAAERRQSNVQVEVLGSSACLLFKVIPAQHVAKETLRLRFFFGARREAVASCRCLEHVDRVFAAIRSWSFAYTFLASLLDYG